ncbi:hypothetical protein BN1723_000641 [Verticillium longisporum]|uniref:FACT complex subunit SSRP1/POB3 N-terminal PH domain-containing protein n=1 Tax=Verticillium longisporum TaxID=100787 RepID=A0A0G4MYD6_VERLO|nr:hypothetical protein BN1723_000641 [Verticillium longisporum]
MAAIESFDSIFLDLSKSSGKCRFAETGLGWKPAGGGDTFTLDASAIASAQWSRAAKGYEIKILSRDTRIIQLDGFPQEEFERLETFFKLKNLRVKNEIDEDANLLKAALREEAMDDSEDEVVGNKADRGSADEDEESVDEDFRADSESDVAEEYDSNPETSDSEDAESVVDNEEGGAGDDDDDDEAGGDDDEERPKKKKKTA